MVGRVHLSKGCQAVGGAGGVGDNLHVLAVASLVHAHHKHWRVSRGGRNDDLRRQSWQSTRAISNKRTKVFIIWNLFSPTLVMLPSSF